MIIHAFADSSYADNIDNRRSTTGYCIRMGRNTILWSSYLQRSVARSTSEAEYMALSDCAQELIWIRRFMDELKETQVRPTTIYEDNQGCIAMSYNPVDHRRSKHIHVRYHFLRELIQANELTVVYCPTEEMIADILNKPLPGPQFTYLRVKLRVSRITHSTKSRN